jgi:hypothetical protein
MAGLVYNEIRKLLDKDDPISTTYIKTKLILKGIDPDKWGPTSEDVPEILSTIQKFSRTLKGVS